MLPTDQLPLKPSRTSLHRYRKDPPYPDRPAVASPAPPGPVTRPPDQPHTHGTHRQPCLYH
ncbi:hypothetical protein HanIR_Chr06g0266621 [Helianthus annuus]|uniref:Uncharacterized protein n=1 Tax=Helianthus annuus TaxID=4232 RepID=A0A251VKW1_HELAN|nr:hypothetical protein HanIR_Chr06g0266621 [Helianthus annuus]